MCREYKKRNPGTRHPLILQIAFVNIQLHIPRETQSVYLGNITTTATTTRIPRFTHLDKDTRLISEVSAVFPLTDSRLYLKTHTHTNRNQTQFLRVTADEQRSEVIQVTDIEKEVWKCRRQSLYTLSAVVHTLASLSIS